jgi:hypothetical protein
MPATDIIVIQSLDPRLKAGDLLRGDRFDDYSVQQYIRLTKRKIGIGVCTNKCKPVDLYLDGLEVLGVSTVLNTRYFRLRKTGTQMPVPDWAYKYIEFQGAT